MENTLGKFQQLRIDLTGTLGAKSQAIRFSTLWNPSKKSAILLGARSVGLIFRGADRFELRSIGYGQVKSVSLGSLLQGVEIGPLRVKASLSHPWKIENEPSALRSLTAPPVLLEEAEKEEWRKSLRLAPALLGGLVALGFGIIWALHGSATHEETAGIPEAYVKLLTAPPAAVKQSAAGAARGGAVDRATRAQDTHLSQALQSKSLQKSLSNLFKSSALRLDGKALATGLQANGRKDSAGDTLTRMAQMAANASGGTIGLIGEGTGSGSGYGSAVQGTVSGQGRAHVSLRLAEAQVEEGLTKEEVGEVIHRHASEIRYCYETAMIRKPDLEGKLAIAFTIGAQGTVVSSKVTQSSIEDPRLGDCVLSRLARWSFPRPKGGIQVPVLYPFVFKSLGKN